jgi:general secretion pathway protein G
MIAVRKGFTLVEVIMVVVLVGILSAIVIPRITYSRLQAQRAACNATVSMLNSQVEYYYADRGAWPGAIGELAPDYADQVPATCSLGSTYVYNITTHRVIKHAH